MVFTALQGSVLHKAGLHLLLKLVEKSNGTLFFDSKIQLNLVLYMRSIIRS